MSIANRLNFVDLGWLTHQMHRDDGFGAWCYLGFDLGAIDIIEIFFNIDKYRACATLAYGFRGRNPCVGGGNDLITGANAQHF